ncbi:hypothetical protein EV648_115168 [Kribbella sp. VKM Ac-2568]|nr:hypothetical protein EV648_115168 [Kribbella sp. VKM Ac-2568]
MLGPVLVAPGPPVAGAFGLAGASEPEPPAVGALAGPLEAALEEGALEEGALEEGALDARPLEAGLPAVGCVGPGGVVPFEAFD